MPVELFDIHTPSVYCKNGQPADVLLAGRANVYVYCLVVWILVISVERPASNLAARQSYCLKGFFIYNRLIRHCSPAGRVQLPLLCN